MICHPRQALFVHIPKTGGQSVETVFLQDQGLTWQQRAALLLRPNDLPARGPEKLAHLYASEYVALGHISAAQFARYRTFAIVRHPYDRFLSEYRYRAAALHRRGKARVMPGLQAFLDREPGDEHSDMARHLVPQLRYVQNAQGQCLVDDVLKFETLAQDIAPVFADIFGEARSLPHRNRSPDGAPVVLTAAQKEQLYHRYRADFEAFGYAP